MIDTIEELKKAAIVAAAFTGLLGACAAVDSAFPAETTVEKLDRLIQAGEFADCETDGEITARAAGLGLDLDALGWKKAAWVDGRTFDYCDYYKPGKKH